MKQLSVFATTVVILASLMSPILATEDTSVSNVVGTSPDVATTTQETNTQPQNALNLEMPSQTDNPSTIITFLNPSKENALIQLEIDSKGFVDITSPYTFPALSIGKHTLEFKYQDENASTQLYDTSIIVIPRAPILGTPVIGTENVTIAGTGLANSEIIVLLSSGNTVLTKTAVIDGDGKWSIDFLKTDFNNDVFSLSAYTRRYGYASNLSETIKFSLDNQSVNITNKIVSFDINSITIESLTNWAINNQNYIILATISLLVGILLGISLVSKKKQNAEKRVEKNVAEKFVKVESKDKEVTLREKLMGATKEVAKEKEIAPKPELEKVEEKKVEEEKVINKIDFLKDFKNFDPDDSKGEEKPSSVEVSLTSKK